MVTVGIHEATFYISVENITIALGVVPASKAASGSDWFGRRYMYSSLGDFYGEIRFGNGYRAGDRITVRLDLTANTVDFRRNGADVRYPRASLHAGPRPLVDRDEAYHFAFEADVFDASRTGSAVTIVDVDEVE